MHGTSRIIGQATDCTHYTQKVSTIRKEINMAYLISFNIHNQITVIDQGVQVPGYSAGSGKNQVTVSHEKKSRWDERLRFIGGILR